MDISNQSSFNDSKMLNIENLKDIPWAAAMLDTLQERVKQSFMTWLKVVLNLSRNEKDVADWKEAFIQQLDERCTEMITDIGELQQAILTDIENYLNKTEKLCKKLQVDMITLPDKHEGLYQVHFHLKRRIKELEQMETSRQQELDELRDKQLILCQALGKEPKIIMDNPLPSAAEIEDFHKYLKKLEEEEFTRKEEFVYLKSKILHIIEELEYVPKTNFEKELAYGSDGDFKVTDSNMKTLENFYNDIQREMESTEEKIFQLRTEIEQFWGLLDIDFGEREIFRNNHKGKSLTILKALNIELERCQQLKKANIKVFIDKLREELVEVWTKCHCSESIKDQFTYFYSDCFTESMMEVHEMELKKWKLFFEENKEILTLISQHQQLWNQMIELEESANGPNRYNNRGGRLLQEEKERNVLAKKIPKIETQLLYLAQQYELKHGTSFLTFGQTVEDYIHQLHADRENAKLLKHNERKRKIETTMKSNNKTPLQTPNLPSASCAGSSSTTMKKRPMSNLTDVKRMRKTPSKINTEPVKKHSHVVQSSGLNTKAKRLSFERKKRLEKIRQQYRQRLVNDLSTYCSFENELYNRVDARSTMNVVANESGVALLPTTPDTHVLAKTPIKITPKSPQNSAKSPTSQHKLTVLRNQTKLIF